MYLKRLKPTRWKKTHSHPIRNRAPVCHKLPYFGQTHTLTRERKCYYGHNNVFKRLQGEKYQNEGTVMDTEKDCSAKRVKKPTGTVVTEEH